MLERLASPLLLALLPLDVPAAPPMSCPAGSDRGECVQVLGCIGEDGLWFEGAAFGSGRGTVSGALSDGTACAGMWTDASADGIGEAQVTCDDGIEVELIYTSQDADTGTTIGSGSTADGRLAVSWSGPRVTDYLRGGASEGSVALPCPGGEIPLGEPSGADLTSAGAP